MNTRLSRFGSIGKESSKGHGWTYISIFWLLYVLPNYQLSHETRWKFTLRTYKTMYNGQQPSTPSTPTFYTPHQLLSLPPNHSTLHSTFTSPIVFSFNTLPHHILYPTTFYFIFLFKFLFLFFMIK
jgi:hypothetical protein